MGVYSFFQLKGEITIYTKKEIKQYISNIYNLEALAKTGNQDALAIYVDIKKAFNRLSKQEQQTLVKAFLYDCRTIAKEEVSRCLNLMEDFLNGR